MLMGEYKLSPLSVLREESVLTRRNGSKGCPKCSNHSLYLDWDEDDWYKHCLLCGYAVPLKVQDVVTANGVSFSINPAAVRKSRGIQSMKHS